MEADLQASDSSPNTWIRIRIEVSGIVQGVGFRPFVYGLAKHLGLTGFVRNTSAGARVEVEGEKKTLERFLNLLPRQAPPLAKIIGIITTETPAEGDRDFEIRSSRTQADRRALISPDVAVCDECLGELHDPSNRRYRYPFINCTNCGPRYTIIMDVPYDRDKTSMGVFSMCPDCAAEYHDLSDRRFHAQPNACPVCGPNVWLADCHGNKIESDDPIRMAVTLLEQGRILAVKGLGGFHLAVDAHNETAVRALRQRKHREGKPMAVMTPDLESAGRLARLDEIGSAQLSAIQRPIVLLPKREPFILAPGVAPDTGEIGIMLPYTPLHHLLFGDMDALVMTSGNISEEPIAMENKEAVSRLLGLADYFLMHNRDIYLRTDDSVVRPSESGPVQLRRSRGYVPVPIFLKHGQPSVLAVGGELKNTICLIKENRAFVSQHIGDLENLAALCFFEMTIAHLRRILDIEPLALAHDLHPDYASTKWALKQTGIPLVGVQHHHAHVASVMAEHCLEGPVIGLACDGAGYGDDGRIWGGEALIADYGWYERRGHLKYRIMPGGSAAVRQPWRMALGCLHDVFGDEAHDLNLDFLKRQKPEELFLLRQVIRKKIASPSTSSLGRLFDAVAALIGLKDCVAFEGQAAMMLEMICPDYECSPYTLELEDDGGRIVISTDRLIRDLVEDIMAGRPPALISGRFHAGIATALVDVVYRLKEITGLRDVVMSGGCFLNQVLTRKIKTSLHSMGLRAYTQQQVPSGDGGLSLGQAVIAAERMSG
jgi:hydrogenase maturation protein HypF